MRIMGTEKIKLLNKQHFVESKTNYVACLRNAVYFLLLNPLNAKLNPICHMLALLGAHPILHISRIRVNV